MASESPFANKQMKKTKASEKLSSINKIISDIKGNGHIFKCLNVQMFK